MTGKISEKILLYKVQTKKDPEAYAKLYDLYVKRIYRFVFFKVSSEVEAEDITSDVFLKAWNYLNANKEVKSFSGLLYRMARNAVIDLYRAKSNSTEVTMAEGSDYGDQGKWFLDTTTKLESNDLLEALKKLKHEYREIITLRYVEELDVKEIAEITGKGSVAVRVTLHRALKKLKEIVEK